MEDQKQKKSDWEYYILALRITGDFGISIAVPAVAFAYFGQWLDEKYTGKMYFTIAGLVLAAIISGIIVYRKAKRYGEQYQNLNKKS